MDGRMAINHEQWDNSNVTKDFFGIGFDMLFSELDAIMVNKVTSLVFWGHDWGDRPLGSAPEPSQ